MTLAAKQHITKEENGAIVFKPDGIRFKPVNQGAMEFDGFPLEKIKYDLINNSNDTLGYLDIYLVGVGNWCFVDWRKDTNDIWYYRVFDEPVWARFGNGPFDYSELVNHIASHAVRMHHEPLTPGQGMWKATPTSFNGPMERSIESLEA